MDAFKRSLVFGYDKELTREQVEGLFHVFSPHREIEVEGQHQLPDLSGNGHHAKIHNRSE